MKNFRSLLKISVVTFMMGCCSGAVSSVQTPAPVHKTQEELISEKQVRIEKIKQTTVALVEKFEDRQIPVCAGVWVSNNMILTAAHCLDSEIPIYTYATKDSFYANELKIAIEFSKDTDHDLALLIADPQTLEKHPTAIVSNVDLMSGDEMDIVGHTMGLPWSYSHGFVSETRENITGPLGPSEKMIQISSPVWMGNSGGGAFDRVGNLAGICSWVISSGPDLSFFVHRDVIQKFLISEFAKL